MNQNDRSLASENKEAMTGTQHYRRRRTRMGTFQSSTDAQSRAIPKPAECMTLDKGRQRAGAAGPLRGGGRRAQGFASTGRRLLWCGRLWAAALGGERGKGAAKPLRKRKLLKWAAGRTKSPGNRGESRREGTECSPGSGEKGLGIEATLSPPSQAPGHTGEATAAARSPRRLCIPGWPPREDFFIVGAKTWPWRSLTPVQKPFPHRLDSKTQRPR